MAWFWSALDKKEVVNHNSPSNSSECPVKHEQECPVKHVRQRSAECPIKHDKSEESQLSSENNIPYLSQDKLPGQITDLSLDRQVSSIPRTKSRNEEAESWVYPSAQQFYTALMRKKFDTDDRDVPIMLSIHNEMNEQCWQEIKRWESLHEKFGYIKPSIYSYRIVNVLKNQHLKDFVEDRLSQVPKRES
jgi:cytochrome c heme-lyase